MQVGKIAINKKVQVVLAALIAGVATVLIAKSFAAAPSVSFEPEKSNAITSPATIGSDAAASGGKFVQYGSLSPTPNPSPTPTPTGGTAYYVDCSAGSDTNTGTSQTSAWKTLSKANSASLASGNSLLFKRGCSFGSGLTVKWSGVTVGNYGSGALPIFGTSSTSGNIVSITGSNNTIDGLEVDGPDTVTASTSGPRGGIAGISVETGAANNVIQNSTITGNYAGIFVRNDSSKNKILHNVIKDNKLIDTGGGAGAFGILMWGHDNLISQNSFSGNYAESALYPPYDGSSIEIYSGGSVGASNNVFSYNTSVNDNAFSELGKASSSPTPDNNIYAYNTYTVQNQGNGLFINTRGSVADGYGPVTRTKVYNNSVYMSGSSKAVLICQGSCSGTGALDFQNNILVSTNSGALSVSGATGSNNITTAADAAYVNAPTDLHLQSTSKAINAGSNVALSAGFNKDLDGKSVPAGSAVDIGAYEYGAVAGNSHGVLHNLRAAVHAFAHVFASIGHFFGNVSKSIVGQFKNQHASALTGVSSTSPCVSAAAPPKWNHVIVIMFENHTYSQIIGAKNASGSLVAPYITSLASKCGSSNKWNDADYRVDGTREASYISKPSYATLTNGLSPSVHGLTDDSSGTKTGVDNIYNQLRLAGKKGIDFYNASGSGCGVGYNGSYHDAVRYYTNYAAFCDSSDLSLSDFATRLNNSTLPDFSLILPTNCDNMHSCSSVSDVVANGDKWISNFMPTILDSNQYKTGDTAVFFLWDEDSPIPNVLLAPSIKPGTLVPTPTGNPISHFSALRTWEEMLGLPLLGDVSKAPSLLSFYNGGSSTPGPTPGPTPTPTPTGDTTSPSVNISSPASGAVVTGTVNVTASASDNVGVTKVDFLVDGTVASTDTSSPYAFAWNTAGLSGSHTLSAKAYDAAGNVGSSSIASVTVTNGCQAVPTTYGQVTASVAVPASGTYHIWSRIMAPDATNNSYYFQSDSNCAVNIGNSVIASGTWTWVDYKDGNSASKADITLTAGSHNLILTGREPGVKLDRVLLLSDACIPTGTGDNCVSAPDTTPPTVALSAPANGATVSGTVAITATASDASGVTKVDFYIDGSLQHTATTSPYNFSWDTSTYKPGSHTIQVKSTDGAGNVSAPSSITVTVIDTTPPTVAITNPANGATIVNAVEPTNIDATANDSGGVMKVDFLIDGQVKGSATVSPFSYAWDTSKASSGSHTLQAKATNSAGITGSSAIITVNVSNPAGTFPDAQAPSVPAGLSAQTLSSSQVKVTWQESTDNVGVAGYKVYRSDSTNALATVTSPGYLDTTVVPGKTYSYTVAAFDQAGNQSAHSSPVSATTPTSSDTTPPTAPQDLHATTVTDTSIIIVWGASTDGSGSIAGYHVYRNGQLVASPTATVYTDTDVNANTSYTYTVKAYDQAANNSSASNSLTVRTNGAPSPAPPPLGEGFVKVVEAEKGRLTGHSGIKSDSKASGDKAVVLYRNRDSVSYTFSIDSTGRYSIGATMRSQDYKGDAEADIYVDGKRVINHRKIESNYSYYFVDKSFKEDSKHTIKIIFVNDKWGGSASTDRNLWVDQFKLRKL